MESCSKASRHDVNHFYELGRGLVGVGVVLVELVHRGGELELPDGEIIHFLEDSVQVLLHIAMQKVSVGTRVFFPRC